MTQRRPTPPDIQLQAHRVGVLPGILLVGWFVGFSVLCADWEPVPYWLTLVCVGILLVALPAWLVGRRAGAAHRRTTRAD